MTRSLSCLSLMFVLLLLPSLVQAGYCRQPSDETSCLQRLWQGSSDYDKEYCRQKVAAFKKESDDYSDCLEREAAEKRKQDDYNARRQAEAAERDAKAAEHKSERAKYWYGCRSGRDYC